MYVYKKIIGGLLFNARILLTNYDSTIITLRFVLRVNSGGFYNCINYAQIK